MLGQASRRVPLLECVRYKRLKFKPKIAHTRPQKTASMLAMEHFDFYYAPVYGKQWPSIRLGLLTPNKYMAIVNTFSRSSEASELILEEIGAVDLIKELIGTIAIEKLEKKRKLMEAKALKQQEQDQSVKGMQSGEVEENAKTPEDLELEDLEMRGEAGLGEFRRSEETLTRSDLQLGRGRRDQRDAHEITLVMNH
ncbi:unnamed protein product [Anisakis simplex]|uniref:5-methylcytosine rRNA methyltransferase NSUN4 (inferred by orthology to a human protein) n=2 Tax=Anisakis simplex TaxID=6269 RepID=A0A0M3J803_ANISI|nr:unnamed protein product [Anisakis simplex]